MLVFFIGLGPIECSSAPTAASKLAGERFHRVIMKCSNLGMVKCGVPTAVQWLKDYCGHGLSLKTSMFDTFSNLQDKRKSSGTSHSAVAQSVERPSKDPSPEQLYWLTWVRIAVIGKIF